MKKLLILLLLAGLIGGGYYLWNHRYEYFFKGELETRPENKDTDEATNNGTTGAGDDLQTGGDGSQTNQGAEAKIREYDCSQGCENRKNTGSYDYCREICGLNEPQPEDQPAATDCSSLENFDKDVCFKRKAVREKKDNVCENISDDQLRQSCINRVMEEILE